MATPRRNAGSDLEKTLGVSQHGPPPPDSLFQRMWNNPDVQVIVKKALDTLYIQGIKNGTLSPDDYGASMVNDSYYCFRGQADYERVTESSKISAELLKYFTHKYEGYIEYNQSFSDKWHIQNNIEDALKVLRPTQATLDYAEHESSVVNGCLNGGDDLIYILIVMLPCEVLWSYLGSTIKRESKKEVEDRPYFDVEVGPIWSSREAPRVAAAWLARNPGYEWDQHWKTTVSGQMSVIGVRKTTLFFNNVYENWMNWNSDQSGGYKMGWFIDNYEKDHPRSINYDKALEMYTTSMKYEAQIFQEAALAPKASTTSEETHVSAMIDLHKRMDQLKAKMNGSNQ